MGADEPAPGMGVVELSGTAPTAREGSAGVELESMVDTVLEAAWWVAMWRVEAIVEGEQEEGSLVETSPVRVSEEAHNLYKLEQYPSVL